MKEELLRKVLNMPMSKNDAGASTIGEYLCNLLLTLWEEGEGFSGKRPFGNSGWDNDIRLVLEEANVISHTKDPYANTIIRECIKLVFSRE